MMKKSIRTLISCMLLVTSGVAVGATPDLPKVEILGKEYYYHEIKKGESIYGIAKKYGWDLEELVRLNPATATDMTKGSRLYYPTGRVTVVTELQPEENGAESVREPIRHLVKRGETVYGIARQYNITVETIYASCPDAKYGIKAGETLVIEQPAASDGGFLYYVIKPGDTLYSLAKRYQTTVEDLLKANPGVSEKNFKIGDTVRVAVNSNQKRIHTELVEEERLAGLDSYKVGKKDDWNTIAQKTGVDVSTLKEANENVAKPKKNDIVNIPIVETVQVEKEIVAVDPREETSEGIREMYDSIHNLSGEKKLQMVKAALLLDEPKGKRDIDFTRGFLTALDGMKETPFKITFKVIDGRSATSKIIETLDDFEPNLVIATADKAFPAFLADYGNSNNVEIINVFDIKNELNQDNPSMIQLLPSSSYFNQQMGEQLAQDYAEREIIMIGNKDAADGIAEALLATLPSGKVRNVSVSNLSNYDIAADKQYLFYSYSTRKEEIADVLQGILNLKEKEPFADITLVGRPSWITFADNFSDKFGETGVLIPSRVWFDTESTAGKNFTRKYTSLFGEAPMKSFPNFAAAGYDVANYFLPATAANGGDYNKGFSGNGTEMVQSDVRLERVNNWGGFVNRVGYFVRYRPGGYVEKIMLK